MTGPEVQETRMFSDLVDCSSAKGRPALIG